MGGAGKDIQLLQQQQQQYLIPGLPDEVAMDCLVRVPYQFHLAMKSVCRRWRNLANDPSFYRERQRTGTAEQLVCLVQALTSITSAEAEVESVIEDNNKEQEEKRRLRRRHCPPVYGLSVYNLSRNTWRRMMPTRGNCSGIPMFSHCVALPISGKLVLLGGWDPETLDSVPDVYVCDFVRGGGWRRAAPMSMGRSFFACAAVGPSSVYVAGGHDNQKNALRSAEVYDADADEWRALPPMAEERDECQGLSCDGDGRFWVVSGYGTESQGRFKSDAECYDPALGSWSKLEEVWPFPSASPRAIAATPSGRWCFMGGGNGGEQRGVMEYDVKEKCWKVVASIPDNGLKSSPCVVTLRGGGRNQDRIFMMGSGIDGLNGGNGAGDRHGGLILELEKSTTTTNGGNSNGKWINLHTPTEFSGFAYSVCSLLL
ncbi:PREDICTED: F-box/kelch-repeat protein At2g44130-like isoform X1 [Nelumbo nucifera]|uniref:F-box/kelch-repeat protein At2g44130-like isoform X1 n=1 Tax=Nelumbo nucifera TaxID=4432 RepID=A0A1U8BKU4_NELNU|nr:PREDICTED: F-box/kelch-repeat protein At2g44130-like isoform X2 [Nelumbo nucifera]XP_019055781.1 PREDICTED: F-box/kelch-repeat protein At2g44130-like isoform X1 [Nelumbo nucifera]